MQKIYSVIVLTLLVLLVGSFTGLSIQTHRLGCCRQQLEYYRAELSAATNRQSELEQTIVGCSDILERDRTILGESADTIQGIREQISEIRKSYESMEDIIDSVHSGGGGGRTGNIRAEEMK